jgi:hypothetical protein
MTELPIRRNPDGSYRFAIRRRPRRFSNVMDLLEAGVKRKMISNRVLALAAYQTVQASPLVPRWRTYTRTSPWSP